MSSIPSSSDFVNHLIYNNIVEEGVASTTASDDDTAAKAKLGAKASGKTAAAGLTKGAGAGAGAGPTQQAGSSAAGGQVGQVGQPGQGDTSTLEKSGAGQTSGDGYNGWAPLDTSLAPNAEAGAQGATDPAQLADVGGLAADTTQAQAEQKLTVAVTTLGAPASNDEDFKAAVNDFVDGMQSLGKGDEAEGTLRQLFAGTSTDANDLGQRYALADAAGTPLGEVPSDFARTKAAAVSLATQAVGGAPDVSGASAATATTATSADNDSAAVTAAKDQLSQDLAAGKTDEDTLNGDIAALQHALVSDGRGDEVTQQLAGVVSAAGLSDEGNASVFASAAKLGIALDGDDMREAESAGKTLKQQNEANRAVAKRAQEEAAAAQRAAAQAASSASSSAAGTMSGTNPGFVASPNLTGPEITGDISNLKPNKTGKIDATGQFGVLPDYDSNTGGVANVISKTGVTPTTVGGYVNMGADGSYESDAADRQIADAAQNGVKSVTLSVTANGTGALTASQVAGLKASVEKAHALGLEVDVRYGYEMNYGGGGATQGGRVTDNNDPTSFQTQWAQVADALGSLRGGEPNVRMVWSPNVYSGGDLSYAAWLPKDTTTVDVVALDYYHTAGQEISAANIDNVVDGIYPIAKALNVPFTLGETGVKGPDADGSIHNAWYTALNDYIASGTHPNMVGYNVFNYNKDGQDYGGLTNMPSVRNAAKDIASGLLSAVASAANNDADTTKS